MRGLTSTLRKLGAGCWRLFRKTLRVVVLGLGIVALVMVVLAFTRVPFDAHRWLGMASDACTDAPAVIVVLGGSGMPSGPELLRLHEGARLARENPQARVAILHPGDPGVLRAMKDELLLRGVAEERIVLINRGENTREQAMLAAVKFRAAMGRVLVVTAPENMRRSVLAFRKAGLSRACGSSAWDHAMDHAFGYDHRRIGGKAWVPDVGEHTAVRYTFWNYLKLEITCLRECFALAYYRVNGWI